MFSSRARVLTSKFPRRHFATVPPTRTLTSKIVTGIIIAIPASFVFTYSFVLVAYSNETLTNFLRRSRPDLDDVTFMYREGLTALGLMKPLPGDEERLKKHP